MAFWAYPVANTLRHRADKIVARASFVTFLSLGSIYRQAHTETLAYLGEA